MAAGKLTQPLKWHGGKGYLAPWIISHMPPHTRYCEPFFGGGGVLFRKPCEGVSEFVNDLHVELTNFWRMLGNAASFERFQRYVETVPLSRVEFDDAADPEIFDDEGLRSDLNRAIAFFIRMRQSRQGLGKDYCTPTRRTRRGMNENVSAWLSSVEGLPEAHARLKRVEIWNVDACEFIRKLDSPETLFYTDPPYLHETRSSTGEYAHEMTEEQHKTLLATLAGIKGKFLLSGYPSKLYEDWRQQHGFYVVTKEIDNKASSAKEKEKRTECLWANYDLAAVGAAA